jgi:general secretion pathway protein D
MASSGSPFTLNVMLENVPDASAALAPLRIHWDSAKLHLNDISPGELFSRDGVALHIEKEIHGNSGQAAGGEATLTVTRAPGSAGISGSGAVATLNFVATSPGTSAVAVLEVGLKTTQSQAIPAATGDVVVTVH